MFPIKGKYAIGYKFGQKTYYNGFHLGVDYHPDNNVHLPVYAPFDGVVKKLYGPEGGNTIWFYPQGKKEIIRFLHLNDIVKVGNVKQGELIAYVGNTGSMNGVTYDVHLHLDIWTLGGNVNPANRKGFIDPQKYNWNTPLIKKVVQKIVPPKRLYVVRKGDTLSGISKKLKVSVGYLEAKNKIKNINLISIGQRIYY